MADQATMDIKVWNKTTEQQIFKYGTSFAEPYDVLMYDSSLQEEIDSKYLSTTTLFVLKLNRGVLYDD